MTEKPVTEKLIRVDAEWGLWGKTLGRAGARVLACSNGNLSMDNFLDLIGRFSLGTPGDLPQVSVSYLSSGNGDDRVYYLGMAVHKWAADVQTDGGELLEKDDDNRPVAVTSYFCIPYGPPSAAAVSYPIMYEKLSSVRLGTSSGPPLPVELSPRTSFPAINPLAMQAASRLLSGRPVCVLNAAQTSMEERLAFIESVTQLLPYGYRTRMTAATWVRPTHREHRFRLYFSDTVRDNTPPDHVVYWGQPEATALTPNDADSYDYDQWLAATIGQLEVLGRLTKPRSFSKEDIQESLNEIGIRRSEFDKNRQTKTDENKPDPTPRQQPHRPWQKRPPLDLEQLLRECARCMRTVDLPQLNVAVSQLKGAKPQSAQRFACRAIIADEHLFRYDQSLGDLGLKLREALLKVVFAPPLTYRDYCLIEDSCLAEAPPGVQILDRDLVRLIMDRELSFSDMRLVLVVLAQMPIEETKSVLDKWYKQFQVTPVQLINTAVGSWHRPFHAWHASVIAADLISQRSSDPALIREVLTRYGYLAGVLQSLDTGHGNTQVYLLSRFLKAAHPNGLTEQDVRQILTGTKHPPSPALLIAVLLRLNPDDTELAHLAREAYVFGTTAALGLAQETYDKLSRRFPFAIGSAPGVPHPYSVADQM